MPRYRILFLLFAIVSCASAQEPKHADSTETYYFDCDAQSGGFSRWNRTIEGTSLKTAGIFELKSVGDDPKWASAGSIWFVGQNPSNYAGIQAFVARNAPDDLQIRLTKSGAQFSPIFATFKWKGSSFPFSMSLSATGELR